MGVAVEMEPDIEGKLRRLEESLCAQIASRLKELGFKFVCVDLDPFRSGRMDEV